MLTVLRTTKVALAVAAALTLALPSTADAQSTGSVRVTVQSAGLIVGVGGGQGVLRFRGKSYPFRVDGLGVGTLGVSRADLVGTASNLRRASDLAGTYTAAGAGIAVAGGARAVTLQNANGVVLNLRGTQAGFQANLGMGGVTITMR